MKSDHCKDAKHDKDDQHDGLRDDKWRFGLRRRERLQECDLLEGLHDPDKDVQVKGGAHHVEPSPGDVSLAVLAIALLALYGGGEGGLEFTNLYERRLAAGGL